MIGIFIAVLTRLFAIVNPMGAVPLFLTMTSAYSEAERQRTARNTSLYFVGILLVFFWAGTYILGFFGLSINALRIAGGVVIFTSGFALQNDQYAENHAMSEEVQKEAMEKPDISFSPMAMPMLSGPGSISLLVGFFAEYETLPQRFVITGVIILNGFIVYGILYLAPFFYKLLGVTGLKVGSRIMSFITMSIGVQYIITGIAALVKTL